MQTDSRKELFETMPVPKAVAAMAIPTIISQLINLVYSLADTFFIGQTGNSYMVAAVTVSFPLFMMTIALANLFGVGGGALGIALTYSLLIALFLDPLLNLLGASPETIGYGRQYVWLVVIIGSTPSILSAAGAHLLRNVGCARQASVGLSGGGILNIILDPLFMFVLLPDGWEIFGAALATMLSNVASCLYILIVIARLSRTTPLTVAPSALRGLTREDVRQVLNVGVPSSILTGLFDVANIVLNALVAGYGDLPLAAMGITMKVERFPNAVNIGICQGMLPIVAYNYSSGNRVRMNDVIRFVRRVGMGFAVAQALETLAFAGIFLRIRCLASPFQFLNYHSSFCLQAMGDGRDTLIHAIVRELVFYIPFMFLLNRLTGIYGLAAAIVAGEACGGIFALCMLRRWLKKEKA